MNNAGKRRKKKKNDKKKRRKEEGGAKGEIKKTKITEGGAVRSE